MLKAHCDVCLKTAIELEEAIVALPNFPIQVTISAEQIIPDRRKKTEPVHLCMRHFIKELRLALKDWEV